MRSWGALHPVFNSESLLFLQHGEGLVRKRGQDRSEGSNWEATALIQLRSDENLDQGPVGQVAEVSGVGCCERNQAALLVFSPGFFLHTWGKHRD